MKSIPVRNKSRRGFFEGDGGLRMAGNGDAVAVLTGLYTKIGEIILAAVIVAAS